MRRLLPCAVLFALGSSGCQPPPADATKAAAVEDAGTALRRVHVAPVNPTDFVEQVEITAAVDAVEDARLSAQSAGTVQYVAERGATVRKGDVVARLDAALPEAALAQARAGVDAARVSLQLARETVRRQQPLYDAKIISALEFERLQAQANQADAQLRQAEAMRKQAQAQVDNTRVVAPINGRVEQQFVDIGEQISPGQPVLRILDSDRVKVVAGVPERYATDVVRGAKVRIQFNAYDVAPREGEVVFVGGTIDPQNRTFPIEVELPNPEGKLKPEMVARVQVTRATHRDALVLPLGAIVRDDEGEAVYVVEDTPKGPRAVRRPVKLGARSEGRIMVTEGLTAGERVVVVGQGTLTNGDLLEVVPEGAR
ncbi:MAG: efflux RND transporter periplasmic adaptor subunit [Myxococcales bacterium]|nr:efflux RND transporter periplasmic adaptor subunit [Myxococcales bacterium]